MRRTLENTLPMIKVTFMKTADLLLNVKIPTQAANIPARLDRCFRSASHSEKSPAKEELGGRHVPGRRSRLKDNRFLASALVDDPGWRVNSADVWLCDSTVPITFLIVIPRFPCIQTGASSQAFGSSGTSRGIHTHIWGPCRVWEWKAEKENRRTCWCS